jgi:hypothetical protein
VAETEDILKQSILTILAEEPRGLEVNDIVGRVGGGNGLLSVRGIRNLVVKMEKEGQIVKRKRWSKRPGAPAQAYFHPDHLPRQLDFLEEILGVKSQVTPKSEIEKENIDDQDELKRLEGADRIIKTMNGPQGTSVLEKIAVDHLEQNTYAAAIITIAEKLAEENPVDLLVRMADWTVKDLNGLADEIAAMSRSEKDFDTRVGELELRITRTKHYFYRFWRLDRPPDEKAGERILELPSRARHFLHEGQRARLDADAARQHLQKRLHGDKLIERRLVPTGMHRSAAGTDASVADLYLEHAQGSFIPPDPVVVTTAGAALKNNAGHEYQDFDIFPDQLRAYADHMAAVEGLVISPALRQLLPEEDFKHTRMAAMELRQYTEDLQIAQSAAKWRPFGGAPLLGIIPRPKIIFRDGRVFPLVHRLRDFEDDGLYGQIVRRQIEKFKQVFHNTVLSEDIEIIYASAVKSPEMSWLAPLVFWYLHTERVTVKGKVVVEEKDRVYRPPFADTAVSHLLFLGLANHLTNFAKDAMFVSCRALRRFSDIAIDEEETLQEYDQDGLLCGTRWVDANEMNDWEAFVRQKMRQKQERSRYAGDSLHLDEYRPFLYLCTKAGVSMCYAASTSVYQPLVLQSGEGGHFLIPRLEVAINVADPKQEEHALEGMLSWLATDGWDLDGLHTQSSFDTGNREEQLPILVPDVTLLAHQTVTFARDQLGEEVQDEIRRLIVELRKRFEKG